MVEHVDFQQLAGADDVARKPDIGLEWSPQGGCVRGTPPRRWRSRGETRRGVGDQRVERAAQVSTRISRRLAFTSTT